METIIEVRGLGKRYGDLEVLRGVDFALEPGDVFGVVGHSGAGKSTLLRCLNGLEDYQEGSVRVLGREVRELDEGGLKALRRDMGMIFQNFNLMERRTVGENVTFPLEVWGTPPREREARVTELLELVGLPDKRDQKPRALSGGQKQRVGIARALALNPRVLLCDEATSALDPKTTLSILDLLMDVNRRFGLTLVVVTHQMEVVKRICNKVVLLDGGVVQGAGETESLFLSPPEGLKKLVQDDYAYIPSGINLRLLFPREIAKESVITAMARELDIDFSVVGGKLERYRDDVLGYLIVNLRREDLPRVEAYLGRNGLFWEVMDRD
ncbi:ABC transporter related protein [Aminomonas paucivorans DSM 12260]|uniref:ABC transporter related protein n=1 Tax=Aminomonas paucivorans DSM 12260 TaxID=584708 RepID=E3CUZ3_9BACT|nr:methionine ABC transporter ATP-binding protein [Aminomonas paucivorans]EFQ23150.1 ABC transporter related protein [Aminomonas paucivorans DSM 12260]